MMKTTMSNKVKKVVSIFMWLLLINVSFCIAAQEAYNHATNLTSIALFSFFTCADLFIRPISAKKDKFKSVSIVSFLLVPFVLVLPFHEHRILIHYFSGVPHWIFWIGIGCLSSGGSLILISRIHLGIYGSSKIVLENEHELVTDGIYQYIRHPLYLGFLLLFFGFSLSFNSFISPFLIVTGLFFIFRKRMNAEETLLKSLFGKEYTSYVKRTARLIPYMY